MFYLNLNKTLEIKSALSSFAALLAIKETNRFLTKSETS